MPSAGHDAIMLDYSLCGPKGEPRIIHVETETGGEPEILVLAPDFETFFQGLVDCSHFEDEEELERRVLAYTPKFQGILDAARAQIRETGGIGHEEFWQELEVETS